MFQTRREWINMGRYPLLRRARVPYMRLRFFIGLVGGTAIILLLPLYALHFTFSALETFFENAFRFSGWLIGRAYTIPGLRFLGHRVIDLDDRRNRFVRLAHAHISNRRFTIVTKKSDLDKRDARDEATSTKL